MDLQCVYTSDRPITAGRFRSKQQEVFGQQYLADQNITLKGANLNDDSMIIDSSILKEPVLDI